jgi:hypothetical protein
LRTLIIAISLSTVLGCTTYHGKLTILSSRPVDFKKNYTKLPAPLSGEDVKHSIVVVPIGHIRINDAVENALTKDDSAFLTDVEIKMRFWQIPILYYQWHLEVTGTAWREQK